MIKRSHPHPSAGFEDTETEFETDHAQAEVEEMEAAAQLLETTNDEELEHFINRLLQNSAASSGQTLSPAVLQPLSRSLRGMAKQLLPIVGGSSPRALSSPGETSLAAAATAFELELEGLSAEELEFEFARRFVRLTRAAGRRAPRFARVLPPRRAGRRALVLAARRHAPGLLRRRRRSLRRLRRRPVYRRARRIVVPAPVVYTEPEPVLPPEPDVVAADPSAAPDAEPIADTDPAAVEPAGDAEPIADATADASSEAPEFETESADHAGGECHCGGTCADCRAKDKGRWVRRGRTIILQDV